MSKPHCVVAWTFCVVITVQGAGMACAQNFPNKPIRIVTTGVGGPADLVSRIIAQEISGPLGQPVLVENRAANVVPEFVVKTPPDGHTLMTIGASLWTGPLLQTKPYEPVRDFLPISLLITQPTVLVVHPSVPVASVKELIALAKARPGELNYAAGGIGGTAHMAAELFKAMAGVNIVGIFYSSNANILNALITGEVPLQFSDAGLVMQHVKAGRLKALAVTSAEPTPLVPGIPTVAGTGVPGYEAANIQGLLAPAKTPDAIIRRVNQEVVRALAKPIIKEQFLSAGIEVVASSPEQLAAVMRSEIARIGKVIKDAGIKVN